MQKLQLDAEEATTKNEELTAKVKALEQENMAKEQEITSLTHRNQLLEGENEKLEARYKDAEKMRDEGSHHSSQNEALQRKLQLLEDEAEEADKNLRETHEKFVSSIVCSLSLLMPCFLKAPSNRHKGWPLRAQSTGS